VTEADRGAEMMIGDRLAVAAPAAGYGEFRPRVPNESEAARASNRRALPYMMARSCEASSRDSISIKITVSAGKCGAWNRRRFVRRGRGLRAIL
jgi:cytochrome c1